MESAKVRTDVKVMTLPMTVNMQNTILKIASLRFERPKSSVQAFIV